MGRILAAAAINRLAIHSAVGPQFPPVSSRLFATPSSNVMTFRCSPTAGTYTVPLASLPHSHGVRSPVDGRHDPPRSVCTERTASCRSQSSPIDRHQGLDGQTAPLASDTPYSYGQPCSSTSQRARPYARTRRCQRCRCTHALGEDRNAIHRVIGHGPPVRRRERPSREPQGISAGPSIEPLGSRVRDALAIGGS